MAREEEAALLERSHELAGGLGAVAFTVLEAMRRSGASEPALQDMHSRLGEAFGALSDADCDLLCRVLYARLTQLRSAGEFYG